MASVTDQMTVDDDRRFGGLADLAAGVYLLAAGVAAMFALGLTMAPFENAHEDRNYELALLGLPVVGLATAARMARAFWRGDSRDAAVLLLASLLSFAVWAKLLGL